MQLEELFIECLPCHFRRGLDFCAGPGSVLDLALGIQPTATDQGSSVPAATAVQSTATTQDLPATAATAATAVRKPKRTVLSLQPANDAGSTATTKNPGKSAKSVKRLSYRPVCRKPSKKAAPAAAGGDDLPASTSA